MTLPHHFKAILESFPPAVFSDHSFKIENRHPLAIEKRDRNFEDCEEVKK